MVVVTFEATWFQKIQCIFEFWPFWFFIFVDLLPSLVKDTARLLCTDIQVNLFISGFIYHFSLLLSLLKIVLTIIHLMD